MGKACGCSAAAGTKEVALSPAQGSPDPHSPLGALDLQRESFKGEKSCSSFCFVVQELRQPLPKPEATLGEEGAFNRRLRSRPSSLAMAAEGI